MKFKPLITISYLAAAYGFEVYGRPSPVNFYKLLILINNNYELNFSVHHSVQIIGCWTVFRYFCAPLLTAYTYLTACLNVKSFALIPFASALLGQLFWLVVLSPWAREFISRFFLASYCILVLLSA